MNYQQFVETMKEHLASILGEPLQLTVHTVLKNNGHERTGITIADPAINISPTIYLEEYYEQFQDGATVQEIAEYIAHTYHEVRFEHAWDVNSIKDFRMMKSKIVYKLVNARRNELRLKTLPHMLFMDLAVIFYVLFEVCDTGTATIPVTKELMELWGTDLKEIHHLARANTPKLLPSTFKPMYQVVEELLGTPCEHISEEDNLMYVLTNSLRSFGAACMLYDGALFDIYRQLGESFYMLPSSVHELIIIPESHCPSREVLSDMITDVNETQVDEEELLSERIYYYDAIKQQLV